jgi:hypothetical protein
MKIRTPSPAMVVACLALTVALGGTTYAAVTLPRNSVGAAQVKNGSLGQQELTPAARAYLLKPRGFARIRVNGLIPSTSYWNMALQGPRRGFVSARTPGGGVTCLKPDTRIISQADVLGGLLQDTSGNDTRLYFDGSYGCNTDEVRVVQKLNFNSSLTNQNFNVVVP